MAETYTLSCSSGTQTFCGLEIVRLPDDDLCLCNLAEHYWLMALAGEIFDAVKLPKFQGTSAGKSFDCLQKGKSFRLRNEIPSYTNLPVVTGEQSYLVVSSPEPDFIGTILYGKQGMLYGRKAADFSIAIEFSLTPELQVIRSALERIKYAHQPSGTIGFQEMMAMITYVTTRA